jgi:zinc transport system ATP-binding protein
MSDKMNSTKNRFVLTQYPIIKTNNLCVSRSGKQILHDVNLSVNSGEFVGIVGPNGSGKSTLLLTILGVLQSQKGTVEIYGRKTTPTREVYEKISWVSQAAANLPKEIRITVRELVQLGTVKLSNLLFETDKQRRRKLVDNAIKIVGLESVQNVSVGRLSGGQRQRAVIARALATDAELILLDEPLVGIDRETRNDFLKLLDDLSHNQGKTIIMISHDLAAIRQTAHRIIYLEETIRFDGKPTDFPNLQELALLRGIKDVHGGHPPIIAEYFDKNEIEESE